MRWQQIKSVVDSTVVRLKVQEIYGHVTRGQENAKPFSASAGRLPCFQKAIEKNVKSAVEPDHKYVE